MGGLYNALNGYNPACLFFMPLLFNGDFQFNSIPRFRDCFLSDDESHIEILTRVGGANRGQGYGEDVLESHPCFVRHYDVEEDNTYGVYVFKCPDYFKDDFACLVAGGERLKQLSDRYWSHLFSVFPKSVDRLKGLREDIMNHEVDGSEDKE